jgi:hypothetical protein
VGGAAVLDVVLRGPLQDSSPVVRRNGATWLLAALVAVHPTLVAAAVETAEAAAVVCQGWSVRLPVLQRCFLALLMDRRQSELAKEVAALGLAATAKAAQAIDEAANASANGLEVRCWRDRIGSAFLQRFAAPLTLNLENHRPHSCVHVLAV